MGAKVFVLLRLNRFAATIGTFAAKVQKTVRAMERAGKNPYRVMGVRKVWSHWMVRMSVFRKYYAEHLAPTVRRIRPEWNGNRLLSETGCFLLADVCRLLPFTTHQLRYQAKNRANARIALGVWKDPDLGGLGRFGSAFGEEIQVSQRFSSVECGSWAKDHWHLIFYTIALGNSPAGMITGIFN